MIIIPASYSKNGFTYRLLDRSAKAAIYEQHHGERLVAYEVVRIRVRSEPRMVGRSVIPAGEYLPRDAEWGRSGWTFSGSGALERARHGMTTLNRNPPTPTRNWLPEHKSISRGKRYLVPSK